MPTHPEPTAWWCGPRGSTASSTRCPPSSGSGWKRPFCRTASRSRPLLPLTSATVEFLTTLDRDRIAGLLQRDEYFWLDLEAPSPDDILQLGKLLGLHELAVEDSMNFGQRP